MSTRSFRDQSESQVSAWIVNHNHPPSLRKESVIMKSTHGENEFYPTTPITEPAYNLDIRVRAYELFEQRGREEGHDLDDWLQAEAEFTMPARSEIRRVAA